MSYANQIKMKKASTISVAVLTYNCEKTLEDAVRGVTAAVRSFKNYEIIISDGGSSDKTLEIAKHIACKNKKIKIVTNENKGIGYSYWLALQNASMEYFTFFPGDNENSWHYFAKTLENVGKADIISPYTLNQEVRSPKRRLISAGFVFAVNRLFGLNLKYYTGNAVYKTKDLKKISLSTYSFAFSPEILIKMIRSGHSYMEYGIKINPTNKTVIFKPKNIFEIIKAIMKLFYEIDINQRKKYRFSGEKIEP
jgi:glycosyltransferase involved in cell wall biosynthesis